MRVESKKRRAELDEATQPNTTLTDLESYVSQPVEVQQNYEYVSSIDVALCIYARLAPYNLYACNKPRHLSSPESWGKHYAGRFHCWNH